MSGETRAPDRPRTASPLAAPVTVRVRGDVQRSREVRLLPVLAARSRDPSRSGRSGRAPGSRLRALETDPRRLGEQRLGRDERRLHDTSRVTLTRSSSDPCKPPARRAAVVPPAARSGPSTAFWRYSSKGISALRRDPLGEGLEAGVRVDAARSRLRRSAGLIEGQAGRVREQVARSSSRAVRRAASRSIVPPPRPRAPRGRRPASTTGGPAEDRATSPRGGPARPRLRALRRRRSRPATSR